MRCIYSASSFCNSPAQRCASSQYCGRIHFVYAGLLLFFVHVLHRQFQLFQNSDDLFVAKYAPTALLMRVLGQR